MTASLLSADEQRSIDVAAGRVVLGGKFFLCSHCERVYHEVMTDEEASRMQTTQCPCCGEIGFEEAE